MIFQKAKHTDIEEKRDIFDVDKALLIDYNY